MQSIEDNPYRILGILAGASDRDILSRASRLKKYISAGHTPDNDLFFPALGPLKRTAQSVDTAAAKLSHNQDKAEAALFWFVKLGVIDEPAIDQLLENNIAEAEAAWARVAKNSDGVEVTLGNFSAYQNLSTLKLSQAFSGSEVNATALSDGILLKLKLLDSILCKDFIAHVCDANFKNNSLDLQSIFLNQTKREAEKRGFPAGQFIGILSGATFAAKGAYLSDQGGTLVGAIEELIGETKVKRKSKPQNAHTEGKKLFEQTRDPLAQLRSMVESGDLKFTSASDKVALEILQCGIDYFNFYQENESVNPGPGAIDCLKKAISIAILKSTKDRCQETIETVQRWIDEKPQRERMKVVFADVNNLLQVVEKYESANTINAARQLLNSCRQYLANIRAHLGSTDELYLGASTRVGAQAFRMVVAEINSLQSSISRTPQHQMQDLVHRLLNTVSSGLEILNTISGMDLLPDFRKGLNDNRSALQSMYNQLSQVTGSSSGSSSGGGCYIATMVYGDYEHPQVQALRLFRDEVLAASTVGRWFIRMYYRFSPGMVRRLRHNDQTHRLIRIILNHFVNYIKK